jgi:hypothetical protein
MRTFRAFHGTKAHFVESIVANGLQPSQDRDDWLGYGSYYFIEGLEDPWISARDWARVNAWDKQSRRFNHADFAVIEFEITVDEECVFDFRISSEAQRFHLARDQWLDQLLRNRATDNVRPVEATYDTELLNIFKVENGIEAMISTFPIQLTVKERWFRFEFNIDNVAVLCLSHPITPPTSVKIVTVDVVTFEELEELEGPL